MCRLLCALSSVWQCFVALLSLLYSSNRVCMYFFGACRGVLRQFLRELLWSRPSLFPNSQGGSATEKNKDNSRIRWWCVAKYVAHNMHGNAVDRAMGGSDTTILTTDKTTSLPLSLRVLYGVSTFSDFFRLSICYQAYKVRALSNPRNSHRPIGWCWSVRWFLPFCLPQSTIHSNRL